ncbi:hypothetical protein D1007_40142 [Hordeum vulgare]|nr:hypothetical protein D1007_40142 [Hordeum vulgare]
MDDMEVDNAEDEYVDVFYPRDLALLLRWQMGLDDDEDEDARRLEEEIEDGEEAGEDEEDEEEVVEDNAIERRLVVRQKEDTGQDISYFEAWTNKCTKDDKDKDPLHPERDWISSKSRLDGENYTQKKLKETYGQEADPHMVPFDPLVAIFTAGGRPNGRMAVHIDSVITSSLSRVNALRVMSTGSTPSIEHHVPHNVAIIE